MTTVLQDHPPVVEAFRKYQQFNQDERLRALDEAHQRYLHDWATDMEEARFEEKNDIARNMKRKGYTISDIAEMTGLSLAEIERID